MNDAHFHLIVNHLPIIIPAIGLLVMLGGFITRSAIVKRTAYLIFILGALCTFPAAFSGEGAEEVVEELHLASHDIIHEHEEAAEVFILFSYALGAVALVGFWANLKNKSFSTVLNVITLALSVTVLFLSVGAATTGGEIRHTEIREDANTNGIEDTNHDEKHEHYDND
ncbi:hypothetical protein [Flavobacterium litorale]|uniref:DUF2231 domain-containing protein n=1 Tax=Flavobacterium litorale TaxID=2856519 RepID=A0ABX8V3J8_9FLAO|nr:hypothetical protein [Flavobacterium litorale]QYJ67414.1 hypothetical protein K1I41_07525 [Flavobacterium litorale]